MNKKIVILALHLGTGGAEKVISNLANLLSDNNDVEIISTYKLRNSPAFYISNKVTINYLTTNLEPNKQEIKFNFDNSIWHVSRTSKNGEIDVNLVNRLSFLKYIEMVENVILEEERKRIETVVIDNKKKDYSKPTTNNSSIKVDDGLDDLGL